MKNLMTLPSDKMQAQSIYEEAMEEIFGERIHHGAPIQDIIEP
jgi:hypothetical protein